jgi:hypothetical protein
MAADTNFGVGLSRPMPGFERPVPDDKARMAPAPPKPTVAVPLPGEQPATTPIGKAHHQIKDALTAFEDYVAPILKGEQTGTITPEGRSEMVSDTSAAPSAAVDAAVAAAHGRATEADRAYIAARRALTPSHSDVVAALRADGYWRRISRELDSVEPEKLVPAAQQAIENADDAERGTLSVELGPYLRSRRVDDGWLDIAFEATSATLRDAAAQRKLARQSTAIISSNARAAKRAMQSAGSGSYRRPRLVDPSAFDPDA